MMTIPTDKYGNVYYGPTTLAQAEREIASIADYENSLPDEVGRSMGAIATEVTEQLDRAGYSKIASALRTRYGI